MRIQCPACGVSGSVDDAYAGKKIRCPKCNEVFRCEDPAMAPSPASGEVAGPLTGREEEQGAGTTPPPPPQEERRQPLEERPEPGAPPPPRPGSGGPAPGAMAGSAEWDIGSLISRAWELTSGAKGVIWLGIGAMFMVFLLFALVAMGVTSLAVEMPVENEFTLVGFFFEMIDTVLTSVFTAGILLMGVKRARLEELAWTDIFAGFSRLISIFIAALLQVLLLTIGFMLLIVPGIYLMIGYSMTMVLIIDRGMGPWEALETSRKAIHPVWWKVFGLFLVSWLILGVSAIPFGIGLIWTLPFVTILTGVLYSILFGPMEKSSR